MYHYKPIFIIFIPLMMFLCIPQSALSQASLDDANLLIRDGWAALRAGNDLEARGSIKRAITAYHDAGKFASESLRIGDLHRIPLRQRPSGAYFLYGQAKLALAQVYIVQRRPMDQIFDQLSEAENAFMDTLKLVDLKAVQRDRQWAERRAKALFALGTVFFLKGDDNSARDVMLDILSNFDPNYSPAKDTLMAIDYVQGRRQDPTTSTGKRLPERPKGNASQPRSMEYVVEIGKAVFGRWGTVAGMLVEDLFKTN